jgi:hypothetical protein
MKDPERFDDRTWRRLFAFLAPDEKDMSRQEVDAELQHLGIDTRPGFAKIQQALKRMAATREARATLEAAKKERPSLLARLGSVASTIGALTKENLRQIIRDRFTGTAQAAFFRKLESAASEDDLKSLLDDMTKLDALTEDHDDANP